MRLSDSMVRVMLDNAPAGLVYLDVDLRVVFANRYCSRLLGYAPHEIVGRCLDHMFDAGTLRYARSHAQRLEKGEAPVLDYVLRHKDGSPRHLKVSAVRDDDSAGRRLGYLACTFDGTSERAARAKLADARTLVDAVLERAGCGRARLGHELRTPLASVVAALDLMSESSGSARQGTERRELLELARQNADRLARLIDRLLDTECE
jgi:PAS domain S-box-containing protein